MLGLINMILSESIEDYLKAIYALQREAGKVLTTQLAECLEVKPVSLTVYGIICLLR